jgi:hypothetical protein
MSNLFVIAVKKTPEAAFLRDAQRMRTLICMLAGPSDCWDGTLETLQTHYRRGMDRLMYSWLSKPRDLEAAIHANFSSLVPFDELPVSITRNIHNNLMLPHWLLEHLCDPKWVDFLLTFGECFRDSANGSGAKLKGMLVHQPCAFSYEPPRYDTVTQWNVTTDFLLRHYNQGDYVTLAGHFLADVFDWRSAAFERVIAALGLFRRSGGILIGQVIYDMIIAQMDNKHVDYEFVFKMMGYFRSAIVTVAFTSLADLICLDEYKLQAEWIKRTPRHVIRREEWFEFLATWAEEMFIAGKPFRKDPRDASPVRTPREVAVPEDEEDLDGTVSAIRVLDIHTGKEELGYVCIRKKPDGSRKGQVFALTKNLKSGSLYTLTLHEDDYEPASALRLDVPWDGGDTLFIPKKARTEHRRLFKKSEGSGDASAS